jgi:hypothetical protein
LIAGTLVGLGDADVGHPAVPEVIDGTQHLGWDFNHQGPFIGIKPDEAVNRIVVGREFHGLGVHQIFPDHVGGIDGSELAQGIAHPGLVDDRDG